MGALAPVSSWISEDDLLLKNAIEVNSFFFFFLLRFYETKGKEDWVFVVEKNKKQIGSFCSVLVPGIGINAFLFSCSFYLNVLVIGIAELFKRLF